MTELYLYGKQNESSPGGMFQVILNQSRLIKGNYHVSPNYGHDLNTSNLDEYLKHGKIKEYPVAVCMTPTSRFVQLNGAKWHQLFFNLFFLTLDNRNQDGTLKQPDEDVFASLNTPADDWAAMTQAAADFLQIFEDMYRSPLPKFTPLRSLLQVDYNRADVKRITRKGNDVYNGVSLTFSAYLKTDYCIVNDYGQEVLVSIELPETTV